MAGGTRKVLLHPDRNGYLYVVDRTTGEVISADPYAAITTIRRILPAHEATLESESYAESAELEIKLPRAHIDALRTAVLDSTAGQARVSGGDE